MREFVLADGTKIEATETGAVTGPDQVGGQHFGRNFLYYRVNGGEWRGGFRNMHRLAEWCELCETLADFLEGER